MKIRKMICAVALAVILMSVTFSATFLHLSAWAETVTTKAWVMCSPDDFVYCRSNASRNAAVEGYLETGHELQVDGKTKNGFAHCVNMSLEVTDGWVYAGYIVFDEPVWKDGATYEVRANGRVACRRSINGARRCWVVDGSTVQVFWMSEEWSITSKGYIRTEFLEEVPANEKPAL